MLIKRYSSFSREAHAKNWGAQRWNVCQFELTYRCPLHCQHCYTDCYNKPSFVKPELDQAGVRLLLEKLKRLGVLWLCFTGGDPLARPDFPQIYTYARKKGFLITIFTSGVCIDPGMIRLFKTMPPFVVELTVNAVEGLPGDPICGVKGGTRRILAGLDMLLEAGVPVKVKTVLTRSNCDHAGRIRSYLKARGLYFEPSLLVHARLNKDRSGCRYRLDAAGIRRFLRFADFSGCPQEQLLPENSGKLFRCAIGRDSLFADPYGNLVPCLCIREPKIPMLELDIKEVRKRVTAFSSLLQGINRSADSSCSGCRLSGYCVNCPGKALLENNDMQTAVRYYCILAGCYKSKG